VGEERKQIGGSVGKKEREGKDKIIKTRSKNNCSQKIGIQLEGQYLLREGRGHH
jgi:hypothetical protein